MDTKLLLGELTEFKRQTISELSAIRKDVHSLMSFRWRLVGAAAITSFIATAVVEIMKGLK